jgi:CDP-diacylglycerol--glycerol-3-phosphate 3-phosphatidyltransferase
LIRILLIPVLVVVYCLPIPGSHVVAAVIFAVAGLTDWLDGYLARYLKQGTRFGAFLDPVADKLIVVVALVLVVGEMGWVAVLIPALIIVSREIVISGLREWMAEIGQRAQVAVGGIAKIKTGAQMLALFVLLLYQPGSPPWIKFSGTVLLYIAAILTIWSMLIYLKAAWRDLTLSMDK